jgi:hypothetical protein
MNQKIIFSVNLLQIFCSHEVEVLNEISLAEKYNRGNPGEIFVLCKFEVLVFSRDIFDDEKE